MDVVLVHAESSGKLESLIVVTPGQQRLQAVSRHCFLAKVETRLARGGFTAFSRQSREGRRNVTPTYPKTEHRTWGSKPYGQP